MCMGWVGVRATCKKLGLAVNLTGACVFFVARNVQIWQTSVLSEVEKRKSVFQLSLKFI